MSTEQDITAWMTQTWNELLGFEPEGASGNLFDLGGDSLVMIELLAMIDQHFEIEFPVASAFKEPTLGSMVTVVQRLTSE